MKHHPTLPTFGALVPGAGGVLGAIMRGELIAGAREPDYAVIVPTHKSALFAPMAWGQNGVDVPGAMSLTDGWHNTAAMLQATSSEVERKLRATSLGSVPLLRKMSERAALDYVVSKPFSGYAEAFRNLRTSLELSSPNAPPRRRAPSSAI